MQVRLRGERSILSVHSVHLRTTESLDCHTTYRTAGLAGHVQHQYSQVGLICPSHHLDNTDDSKVDPSRRQVVSATHILLTFPFHIYIIVHRTRFLALTDSSVSIEKTHTSRLSGTALQSVPVPLCSRTLTDSVPKRATKHLYLLRFDFAYAWRWRHTTMFQAFRPCC